MMNTQRHIIAVFFVVVLCSSADVAGQAPPPQPNATLRGLFVIHRHGARVALPPANSSLICGDYCGQLTSQGADMLFALGQYLRRSYPSLNWLDPGAVSIIGNQYNPNRLVTRSTDVDRTIQSAGAFLRGIVAHSNGSMGHARHVASGNILPVINTVSVDRDYDLLVWASWPSLLINSVVTQNEFNVMMDERIRHLLNDSDFAMIGLETELPGLCASQRFQCALAAQDVITCAVANGAGDAFPFLQSKFSQLTEVIRLYNIAAMYNTTKKFDRQIGTKGYPLAMLIAQLAHESVSGEPGVTMLREYSGHDITLMPFAETIGNLTLDNPLFGAAYILEAWRLPSGNAWVRLRYGEPDQTYGSSHNYSVYYAGLKCIDPGSGAAYDAPRDVGCPLSQWESYLQTRGPRSAAGRCYLTPGVLRKIECIPGNERDRNKTPPTELCRTYRRLCPLWACLAPHYDPSAVHWAMSPSDLCLPLQTTTPAPPSPSTHGTASSVPVELVVALAVTISAVVCVAISSLVAMHIHNRRVESAAALPRGTSAAYVAIDGGSEESDGLGTHDHHSTAFFRCCSCCFHSCGSEPLAPTDSR